MNLLQLGIERMDQVSMASEFDQRHVDYVTQWRNLIQTTEQIIQPETFTTTPKLFRKKRNHCCQSTQLLVSIH